MSTEGAKLLQTVKSEPNVSEEGYNYSERRGIQNKKAKKQPALTPEKIERRLKWAKQLLEEITKENLVWKR